MKIESQESQKENPLVSIIIPTYNRAHIIGETLNSIFANKYNKNRTIHLRSLS